MTTAPRFVIVSVAGAAITLLGLLLGAAFGEDPHLAQALGPLMRLAALEDGGEVVRDDDHAPGLAKTACAADTPARRARRLVLWSR